MCLLPLEKKNLNEITAWIVADRKINNMKDLLEKKLPNYMIPKKAYFIETFPLNNNGKIDKNKIKSKYYD